MQSPQQLDVLNQTEISLHRDLSVLEHRACRKTSQGCAGEGTQPNTKLSLPCVNPDLGRERSQNHHGLHLAQAEGDASSHCPAQVAHPFLLFLRASPEQGMSLLQVLLPGDPGTAWHQEGKVSFYWKCSWAGSGDIWVFHTALPLQLLQDLTDWRNSSGFPYGITPCSSCLVPLGAPALSSTAKFCCFQKITSPFFTLLQSYRENKEAAGC